MASKPPVDFRTSKTKVETTSNADWLAGFNPIRLVKAASEFLSSATPVNIKTKQADQKYCGFRRFQCATMQEIRIKRVNSTRLSWKLERCAAFTTLPS
eukprot:1750352-Rhodomonas_salina.1